MRVSIAELGGQAMSRLLDTIDSDGERVAPSATLVPELIVRESSIGAVPQAKK
jgi:LacI family transcriptional regulator